MIRPDDPILDAGPRVHPSAVIGYGAKIGDRTIIGAHAVIHGCVRIGSDCIIDAGAIIGGTGFGYAREADGSWTQLPHPYGVAIGDNVHIGSGCVIHRGRRTDTIIGSGCRIGPLCHLGHNCELGEHAVVITGSVLNGSTFVGTGAYIGSNATTREGSVIDDGGRLGMGSVLLGHIPAGETWVGVPARRMRAQEPA